MDIEVGGGEGGVGNCRVSRRGDSERRPRALLFCLKNIRNLTKIGIEEYREGLGFREEKGVNKVVVRFADGRTVKGTTADFVPTKDLFHVNVMTDPAGAKPVDVSIRELKALFFVKDFKGDSQHAESNKFDPSHPPAGRRIRVEFKDGEIMVGTTTGYQPGRQGFFLTPADLGSNIERCYIVSAATREISFI